MPAPVPATQPLGSSDEDGEAEVTVRSGLLDRRSRSYSGSGSGSGSGNSNSTVNGNNSHTGARTRPRGGPPPLTRLNGLAVVISLQIGSGIFAAPSLVSRLVGSPAEGLAVFVLAGLLVWTGALSFVELGQRVPANGGIQEYLRASWGDWAAYSFTWIWVGVAKPAGNAVIATIFAEYVGHAVVVLRLLLSTGDGDGDGGGSIDGEVPMEVATGFTTLVALACIAFLTVVNCLGATAGAKAANVFLFLKLAALGSIIIIGFSILLSGHGDGVPASKEGWFGGGKYSSPSPPGDQPDADNTMWTRLGNYAEAAFAALFCYGGWETVGFFAGDMKDPAADLPVIINGAMTLVIIGFFLMNVALYVCLPLHVIRASTTVAVEFARQTIGIWGGLVFSLVVAVSAMGAINANLFATAKLAVAASQRAYFPAILANSHCGTAREEQAYLHRSLPWLLRLPVRSLAGLTQKLRYERSVPMFALLLNGVLTAVFVLVGTFSGLINLIEMTKALCYMMSVLGLFSLRRADEQQDPTGWSDPRSRRRHKTWSGNPVIFATVSGLLIVRGALSATQIRGPSILFLGVLGLAAVYRRYGSRGYEISPPV